MEAIDRLRTGFRQSSTLMKIVWVNVAVFVLLRLIAIVLSLIHISEPTRRTQ